MTGDLASDITPGPGDRVPEDLGGDPPCWAHLFEDGDEPDDCVAYDGAAGDGGADGPGAARRQRG